MTKKRYMKPEIVIESFELSTNIALGCEHIANSTVDVCSYTENGLNIFIEKDVCEYASSDGIYGICYHRPTDDNNVFSS